MPAAEAGELEAFADLYAAAPAELGARLERIGGAVCLAFPAVPRAAMFNRVLGLGLERPANPEQLDEVLEFFRGLGVEWCAAVAPQAKPPELDSWLEARGLAQGYAWAKFRRGVDDLPPGASELRVERAGKHEGEAFADTFAHGYGVPGLMRPWLAQLPGRDRWHCFVAYNGEAPAATGAVYVNDGVGWLGIAATLPEHRRRGAQGALLAARIRAAAEAGCEVVVTETGALVEGKPSNSYRNILRAGFQLEYERANYLSSAAADTSGTV